MRTISITEARNDFSEVSNEVNYTKSRIIISKNKKNVAAIIPIEDLEILQALENSSDIHEARLAIKEIKKKGSISFEEMKKSLR